MNKKNYFFLLCLAAANTQFAMERNEILDFDAAYNQLKEACQPNSDQSSHFFDNFDNQTSIDQNNSIKAIMRGSFFSTESSKKDLEALHKKFFAAIYFSNISVVKKMIAKSLDLDFEYRYNNKSAIEHTLDQYFLQRELILNIVLLANDQVSGALKKDIVLKYDLMKSILFDIIESKPHPEKKPNLNVEYVQPATKELKRGDNISSTPLKEAIRSNDRPLIMQLLTYNADLNYKGLDDKSPTPLELAQNHSKDLAHFLTKISGNEQSSDEEVVTLDPEITEKPVIVPSHVHYKDQPRE